MITKEERAEVMNALKNVTQGKWNIEGREIWVRRQSYGEGKDSYTWVCDVTNDDNRYLIANAPTWLRQYEDTVTELEERLKSVSEAKEMQELMYMWDLKGIAKDELEGYEQAVILELIEHCESIVSQLEKGDKT